MSVASALNLQYQLQEIKVLKQELDKIQIQPPAMEARAWEQIVLDWSYNALRLQGLECSYSDAELFLRYGKKSASPALQFLERHAAGIKLIQEWANDPEYKIDEQDVWALFMCLTGLNENMDLLTPTEKSELLDFPTWYRVITFENHPVKTAAALQVEIMTMKLFGEYDAAIGRLLGNYHLLRNGYPPVIIRPEDGADYEPAQKQALAGDENALATYLASRVLYALEQRLLTARGEQGLQGLFSWEDTLYRLFRQVHPMRPPAAAPIKLQDSLQPLFQLVFLKTAAFDGFYGETQHSLFFQLGGISRTYSISAGHLNIADLLTDEYIETCQEIGIELCWQNPQTDDARAPRLRAELIVYLETTHYGLVYPDRLGQPTYKPYGQALTDEENRQIINHIGEYLLKQMLNG